MRSGTKFLTPFDHAGARWGLASLDFSLGSTRQVGLEARAVTRRFRESFTSAAFR